MSRIAVIGLGWFGLQLAKSLTAAGADVIGIDKDREIIERVRDEIPIAVCMDCTDKDALLAQGVNQCPAVVVGIGQDFEAAVLVTGLLKDLKVPRIICRAESGIRREILERVGAHETVNPEGESAERWSHRLMLPKLEQYVELGPGHSLLQVGAPASFLNKTPGELKLRQKHEVNLVAIRRKVAVQAAENAPAIKSESIMIPTGDTKILPEDVLTLIGSNEALSKLAKL